jgi:hypothetical protein
MPRIRECKLPWEAAPYLCGTLAKPLKGASKSGFVNCVIVKNGKFVVITMGNKSSPFFNNKLFVKSFTLGGQTAPSAEITILDSSGNDFNVFFSSIWKANAKPSARLYFYIEFGWIINDCNGQTYVFSTASVTRAPYFAAGRSARVRRTPSGFLRFGVQEIDVSEVSAGAMEYKIKLVMESEMMSIEKSPVPIGRSEHKVPLKKAAEQALVAPINAALDAAGIGERQDGNVVFARFVAPGQVGNSVGIFQEYNFLASDGGKYGPASIWDSNRTNPILSLRQWMVSMGTDRNLGVTLYADPTIDNPNVVMLEADARIFCDHNKNPFCKANDPALKKAVKGKSINKNPKYIYLINASDCSPVLDFKPNVKYFTSQKPNPKGSNSFGRKNARPQDCDKNNPGQNAGARAQITVPTANLNFRAPQNAMDAEANAFNLNIDSDFRLLQNGFEVDLKIEGNPEFTSLEGINGYPLGIIYFNRASVISVNTKGNQQCEWLAYPAVNKSLSSTNYMIKAASHTIAENGEFTTTLKLTLPFN